MPAACASRPVARLLTLCVVSVAMADFGAADSGLSSYALHSSPRLGLHREHHAEQTSLLHERLQRPIYGGDTIFDLASQLHAVLSNDTSSNLCVNQTEYMLTHLSSPWALQMLDSLGKPAAGLLYGNIMWLGDFDECTSAQTGINDSISFVGQYCKLSLPVALDGLQAAVQLGVCMPSGCSSDDTAAIFNIFLTLLKHNGTGLTAACHSSTRPLDSGAVVAIVILSFFAIGLFAGTLYDISINVAGAATGTKTSSSVLNDRLVNTAVRGLDVKVHTSEYTPLLSGNAQKTRDRSDNAGIGGKLLLSFSVYTNGQKLLSTAQGEASLSCLHGIRFISMCWVVMGHTYAYSISALGSIGTFMDQTLKRPSYQVFVNGTVCVDTFFLLSGLLVTYVTLKEFEKKKGRLRLKDWTLIYVHRYVRLTAPYGLLLMIYACLASYFYDGPSWPISGSLDPVCTNYWWTNFLYINNFVPPSGASSLGCMGWTWYLANDMQFFLITPIIALALYKWWYIGVGITTLLTIASIGAAAAVSVRDSLQVGLLSAETLRGENLWFGDYYTKPWVRFQSYGIGILLGYLLYLKKEKFTLSRFVNMLGWMTAAACCLSVIYGPYEAQAGSRAGTATPFEAAAYNSLSRTVWAIGVAWVIFACCTSNGGWVNMLLSWKPFIPLARLTYCAYLIHPILLIVAEYSARKTIDYDDITMTLRFLGILVLAMSLAFVASLAFEAPVMGVEKLLLHPRKKT